MNAIKKRIMFFNCSCLKVIVEEFPNFHNSNNNLYGSALLIQGNSINIYISELLYVLLLSHVGTQ